MNAKIELGYDETTGIPVCADPLNSNNGHIALIGASGGGKSVEAQRIMCSLLEQGKTILNISHHGSFVDDQILPYYKETIDKYSHNVDATEGIPLPLFTPMTRPTGYAEKQEDTIGALTDVFSRVLHFGCRQREVFRTAAETVMYDESYKTDGFAAIGHALGDGEGIGVQEDQIYDKLRPLFYHNVFQDGDDLILPNRLNTVYLDKLDVLSQDMVREVLLSYIWRCANADNFKESGLYIFIDECQNASSGSRDSLSILLSEGRKMGINLILATQFLSSKNALMKSISQCDLMLYFRPAANLLGETASMISRANCHKWIIRLRGLRRGQFVAIGKLLYGKRAITTPMIVSADTEVIKDWDTQNGFFITETEKLQGEE